MTPRLPTDRIESQKSLAPVHPLEIAIVKMLLDVGFQHKRIAALFDSNQGRIGEISKGGIGRDIEYSFSFNGGESREENNR